MKKRIIAIVALSLAVLVLVGGFISVIAESSETETLKREERIFTPLSEQNWNIIPQSSVAIPKTNILVNGNTATGETLSLSKGDAVTVKIPEHGFKEYKIAFNYRVSPNFRTDLLMELKAGDKADTVFLPKLWCDEDIIFRKDKYGNEVPSAQKGVEAFVYGYIMSYTAPGMDEWIFDTKAGGEITFKSTFADFELKEVSLVEVRPTQSYKDYKNSISATDNAENEIKIEAEEYSVKSSSSIHGSNLNSIKVTPYNTYKKLNNVIEGSYWNKPASKILWEFEVENDGWYNLGFRYTLGGEANKDSYRNIEIDGQIPFKEFSDVTFESTNSGYAFKNKFLTDKDGKPYKIYLTKGNHTIALKNTIGEMGGVYTEIQDIMTELNKIGLELQRLTSGDTDANRTWDLELYMPDTVPSLEALSKRIEKIYKKLCDISGGEAEYANNLIFATEKLEKLLENTRTIPNNIHLLNVGDDSAAKYLGTVLVKLTGQPLTLDCIFVSGKTEAENAGDSFIKRTADSLKRFCYSYLPKEKADKEDKDKKTLTVWMNRPMQYLQTLQQLIDADDGALNGFDIELSLMQNAQKMVLANASGSNPDAVISIGLTTPFDYAIRDVSKDLTEYEDFLDFCSDINYNAENLVTTSFNGGVYGLVETVDCKLLYYRTDILEELGLEVPDTWEDVKRMMPTLLGHSYNFFTPLSAAGGMKGYGVTSPFMYQNGGSYFGENGLTTTIGSDSSLKGFYEMTDIFNVYSLNKSVPSFYNSFRYGEIPIGIDGLGTYLQLSIAAPELNGLWSVALTPGTKQADGSIARYQPASGLACMIFENTKMPDEAWSFIKWWMSDDIQLGFGENMERIYGMSYRYNSANLTALSETEYSERDKQIILEQLTHQKETVPHPANYMIEREVSSIWNSVVVDGENLQEVVDKSEIAINREIERKMQEFGFIDENGKVLKEFRTDTIDILREKIKEKESAEK